MIEAHVVCRVGLDDVRSEFDGLSHQRKNFVEVSIHHVSAGLLVRLKDQRLNHERQAETVALRFEAQNILDALVGDLGLLRDAEQVHDHARGVQTQRLFDRRLDHATEQGAGQHGAVNIRHVGAQHQRRFLFSGQ